MLDRLKQIARRAFSSAQDKPATDNESFRNYSIWQTGLNHDLTKDELSQLLANIPGLIFQFYHRNNGEQGFHYVSPRLA